MPISPRELARRVATHEQSVAALAAVTTEREVAQRDLEAARGEIVRLNAAVEREQVAVKALAARNDQLMAAQATMTLRIQELEAYIDGRAQSWSGLKDRDHGAEEHDPAPREGVEDQGHDDRRGRTTETRARAEARRSGTAELGDLRPPQGAGSRIRRAATQARGALCAGRAAEGRSRETGRRPRPFGSRRRRPIVR